MKSNTLKRILGVFISIILFSSAILLISIFAVSKIITPDNIKQIVSNINVNDIVMANDSQLYKQITDLASKNGISKEQVDQILASEASSEIVIQYTSDIMSSMLNGEDLNLMLGSSLERAIDNNSDELASVLSNDNSDIEIARKKIEEIKPELVKNIRQNDNVNQIINGNSSNNQFSQLGKAISLYSKFAMFTKNVVKIICIVLIIISIILLFVISYSRKSFGLWYGINALLISLSSCVVFFVIKKLIEVSKTRVSDNQEFIVNIFDTTVSPIITVFQTAAYITAWVAVIGFIIQFVIKRLLNANND